VLIGDTAVGKTYLLNRYIKDATPLKPGPTVGVEFATKIVALKDGVFVKAQIWDTAGLEKYKAMTAAYCLARSVDTIANLLADL
jgi:small GTP-binding protein